MVETVTTVRSIRWLGDRTFAIDLESPPSFDPKPGQFVLIRATIDGEEYARHYTMSSPEARDTFELTVTVDPTGTLSGWLADREPGERIRIAGPYGQIFYDGEPSIGVLGGGPGIGAGLGVVERAVGDGNDGAIVALLEEDRLIHGPRFGALARAGVPCFVCRSEASFLEAVGSIATDRPGCQWFVFGFKPFAELSKRAMEAAGADPAAAAIENYGG